MSKIDEILHHVVLGADHAGYVLKQALGGFLKERGFSAL